MITLKEIEEKELAIVKLIADAYRKGHRVYDKQLMLEDELHIGPVTVLRRFSKWGKSSYIIYDDYGGSGLVIRGSRNRRVLRALFKHRRMYTERQRDWSALDDFYNKFYL